jgi:hypothetical protein
MNNNSNERILNLELIKSKKIFIPGESSFHFSPNGYTNLNKLFNFSKR